MQVMQYGNVILDGAGFKPEVCTFEISISMRPLKIDKLVNVTKST